MPTTEERLAALETKLAALTETTPTTYYEHQYSGEEIDAAVGRALTGGALDTSVTNVSNQLGTFVRPNLLDNWYFGRPVDQRGGYIVPKGVNYYKVDGFVPQGPIPETVRVDYIDDAGSARFNYGGAACYVPKDGGYVRGYKGDWIYSFDRWKISPSATVSVSGGGLSVIADFQQAILSTALILGQKYTMSVLSTDGRLGQLTFTLQQDVSINQGFGFGYFVVYRDVDQYWFRLYGSNEATYLAIKLELGPTQTLAHREGDRWVMNEVPEYGGQLRRCQMDLFKIGDAVRYCSLGNGVARDSQFVSITIPTPVTMRTMPVLIAPPVGFAMRHNDTIISGGASFSVDAFSQNSIMLKVQSQVALTPGDMWEAFLQPNGSLVFSAEL